MGPKAKKGKQKRETYVPELVVTAELDANELIAHIAKMKLVIQQENTDNEKILCDIEKNKTLHELNLESWQQLMLKKRKMEMECEFRSFENDAELRDREEKIRNVQYERTGDLISLRKQHVGQARELHINRIKLKLMELSDINDWRNKLVESYWRHEDAVHFILCQEMNSSNKEDILAAYDQYNEQRCKVIEEEWRAQSEDDDSDDEYETLAKDLKQNEVAKMTEEKKILNTIIDENEREIRNLERKLGAIKPCKRKVREKEEIPEEKINARVRFYNLLRTKQRYEDIKNEIDMLKSMDIILEHLEDEIKEKISIVKKQLLGGISYIGCDKLKRMLNVCDH